MNTTLPQTELPTAPIADEMAPAPTTPLPDWPEPVITEVVYPDGQTLTTAEAAALDAEAASQAAQSSRALLFDDEGAETGFLVLKNDGFRDETIWFGTLSDELTDAVEEMPLTLSRMTGCAIKTVGAEFSKKVGALDFDKQLEIKRFLSDLYRRVRLEAGLVRRWTLESRSGGTRAITPETIEKLPIAVRQALSQAIIDHATSGKAEHEFFLTPCN